MARTLLQILLDAQAFLDLDATTTPTGTDLTTRANYADKAVREAADVGPLKEFNVVQLVTTSAGPNSLATLASISLSGNFREFLTWPHVGNDENDIYPEIRPQERFHKQSSDRYCYVLGNPSTGYTAVFNNLTANATLSLDFQRYPSGLLTLTDVCELPNDLYVVEKIKSYVLQARTDERFPTIEANANRMLQNMFGRESKTPGGGTNTTPKTSRYRIGT